MSRTSTVGIRSTTTHTTPEGQVQVIYHSTAVVSFNHKLIILNHGGWMTLTTKTRMNQASQQYDLGYQVYQKDFDWFITFKGKDIPFEDRTLELRR